MSKETRKPSSAAKQAGQSSSASDKTDPATLLAEAVAERDRLRRAIDAMHGTGLAKALLDSEAHNKAVLAAMPDLMFGFSREGEILYYNAPDENDLYRKPEEFLGKNIHDVLPDNVGAKYRDLIQRTLETGQLQPLEYQLSVPKGVQDFECRMVVSGPDQVLAIVRNITERKQAQEVRDHILNQSHDLICIAGVDGYFKYVNPAWERTLGYKTKQLLLQPFLNFIHPEDHGKNDQEVTKLASGQPTVDFENRYIRKDGSIRTISWTATPGPEKGVIYCIGRDITERKQAVEALRKAHDELEQRVKDRTATLRALAVQLDHAEEEERKRIAQILHDELQQIITGARFALGSLKAERGSGKERQYILSTVDSYLGEAQQSMRTLSLDLHPLVLDEVDVDAVLNWLKRDMQQKFGLTVEVNVDDTVELTTADLRRLVFQSVRELLFNVVKHAGVKSARVRLKPIDADRMLIEVKDAGTGFNATQSPSTSFGLARIRERVDYIGGQMKIQSAPGKGTCITLTLPRI